MSSKREKMFKHVEAWDKRKEDRESYCARHGISTDSLRHWTFEYYLEKWKEYEPELFEEIKPETTSAAIADPETSNDQCNLELVYPNGVVLRLPSGVSLSMIQDLIKLV